MLNPLVRKYFFISFVVTVVMVLVCGFVARYVERFERERFFKNQSAEIIAQIQAYQGDKQQYVKQLNELNEKMHSPLRIEMKDGAPVLTMRPFGPGIFTMHARGLPPGPPPPGDFGDGPPPGGPPPDGMMPPPGPPPGMGFGPGHHGPGGAFGFFIGMPIVPFLAMIVALLMASGVSVILMYRSLRDKSELAKEVLTKMQQGDLKARFPVSKWDEASQIFKLYNQMADEIERLVSRLMENEKTRVNLLQELAHDLRTPVSSLRNVVETIRYDEDKLDKETKEELKEVALHETEYLSRLVEDLLFLALVLEPKYKSVSEEVSIRDLVMNQMNASAAAHPKIESDFEMTGVTPKLILGNSHLLRRLLRNAFENAFSFAKSKVTATLMENLGTLTIVIRDDGPGLTEAQLENWGKKKAFARQQTQINGRLSVGLGSVIIQTIASAHGGHASIHNVIEDGKIVGAEIMISIRSNVRAVV